MKLLRTRQRAGRGLLTGWLVDVRCWVESEGGCWEEMSGRRMWWMSGKHQSLPGYGEGGEWGMQGCLGEHEDGCWKKEMTGCRLRDEGWEREWRSKTGWKKWRVKGGDGCVMRRWSARGLGTKTGGATWRGWRWRRDCDTWERQDEGIPGWASPPDSHDWKYTHGTSCLCSCLLPTDIDRWEIEI